MTLKRPVYDANAASGSFGDLPEWDLTDLYPSPDSPEFSTDLARLKQSCAGFAASYEGKLAALDAAGLLDCVQAYEQIDTVAGRIMSYAGLRYYQNTMDSDRAKFMADAEGQVTDFTTRWCFSRLEFNRLDEGHLAGLLAAERGSCALQAGL